MGKITVRRTGDWAPGKRTKEYRENFDGIFNPKEKADDGEGDIIGEHDTRTQMTHNEFCDCGCNNLPPSHGPMLGNSPREHLAVEDA